MKVSSLLRYPGGKTRAVKYIKPLFPKITEMASPFFGGGSIEFSCISDGIKVYGADIFKPLVSFWQEAIDNPQELADEVEEYFPCSKKLFKEIQEEHIDLEDRFFQAAQFYVLNRCSFSGTSASGGMSNNHPRFTESSISKLRNWKCSNLDIKHTSFEDFIPQHKDKFMYLDPPYLIENYLYGNKGDTHKNFNHLLLRELIDSLDNGWVLSYNDSKEVRDLYKDYEIRPLEWSYSMNASKKSSEVVILG